MLDVSHIFLAGHRRSGEKRPKCGRFSSGDRWSRWNHASETASTTRFSTRFSGHFALATVSSQKDMGKDQHQNGRGRIVASGFASPTLVRSSWSLCMREGEGGLSRNPEPRALNPGRSVLAAILAALVTLVAQCVLAQNVIDDIEVVRGALKADRKVVI